MIEKKSKQEPACGVEGEKAFPGALFAPVSDQPLQGAVAFACPVLLSTGRFRSQVTAPPLTLHHQGTDSAVG